MMPRVWAITDPSLSDDELVRRAEAACAAGKDALCIHLRDKSRGPNALRPVAVRLRVATRAHGAWLTIGDHPSLADDVGADAAHGWTGRGTRTVWSVPAHADGDVRRAVASGAEVVLVSPIFASPEKGRPRGVAAIEAAHALAPELAVFALGGVDTSNARACFEAGASGVAVMRAVFSAGDPAEAVRSLLHVLG